jgi:hypothetical protein
MSFPEEHDTKSTFAEVRNRWRLREADGELTTSSLTDENEGLVDMEEGYEFGFANLVKCDCQICMDERDLLIAEYLGAVQRVHIAVQEAESRLRTLQEEIGEGVSEYASDWVSAELQQDEQDADTEQDIAEDETKWVAKVDACLLDQDGNEVIDSVLRGVQSAQASQESGTASTEEQP